MSIGLGLSMIGGEDLLGAGLNTIFNDTFGGSPTGFGLGKRYGRNVETAGGTLNTTTWHGLDLANDGDDVFFWDLGLVPDPTVDFALAFWGEVDRRAVSAYGLNYGNSINTANKITAIRFIGDTNAYAEVIDDSPAAFVTPNNTDFNNTTLQMFMVWYDVSTKTINFSIDNGTAQTYTMTNDINEPSGPYIVVGGRDIQGASILGTNGKHGYLAFWHGSFPGSTERTEFYNAGSPLNYSGWSQNLKTDLWEYVGFHPTTSATRSADIGAWTALATDSGVDGALTLDPTDVAVSTYPGAKDVRIFATVVAHTDATNMVKPRLVFRHSDASNYMALELDIQGQKLRVIERQLASEVEKGSYAMTINDGEEYDIGVDCSGDNIRMFLNGQVVGAGITDSFNKNQTVCGVSQALVATPKFSANFKNLIAHQI